MNARERAADRPGPAGAASCPDADTASRITADRELLRYLEKEDFAGPVWDFLANELARYGLAVMSNWIRTGIIYRKLREKGINVRPATRPITGDDIDDLASLTVATALRRFQDQLVREWERDTEQPTTSLASYFIGSCLYAFPNIYRKWLRDNDRWDSSRYKYAEELATVGQGDEDDPANLVASRDEVRRTLQYVGGGSRRVAQAVALSAEGYSHREIAQLLETTARAVEGLLRRYRARRKSEGHTPA